MDRQKLEELLPMLNQALMLYQQLPPQLQKQIAPQIEELTNILASQWERINAAPPPPLESPIPEEARALWALSRGDPDVWRLYMQTYPNPQLNAIANSPAQLEAMARAITGTQSETIAPQPERDGIPGAPLKSSNVYGFRYDPTNFNLRVRFNDGSVYRYDKVPPIIFDMFSNGAGVAKTTGKNKFGAWWRGKTPSLGASVHQLLIAGKFPYRKIK